MNIVQKKDYYKNKPELFTAKLEIFAKENPPKRVNRPEACGLRHLAFSVDSVVLALGSDPIKSHAVKQYLPDYMGLIFEKMCRDYLLYYSDSLPIELSEIGQWWGTDSKKKKQIQIDIVGTPVEGKDYIIGSCKYRNEKIDVDELDLIRDYASVFGKGNNYHYYIFSKGGFTEGLLQAQERGEVRLITLEDLYK